MAGELPARTSARQLAAFLLIAQMNALGHSITLSDLYELAGFKEDGEPVLGPTMDRTIEPFLMPIKKRPDSLGWIMQEPDEDDLRRKYLRLTEKGKQVALKFLDIMERTREPEKETR